MVALLSGDPCRRKQIAAAITLLLITPPATTAGAGAGGIQYKVGNLNSWGAPPPFLSDLYDSWTLNQHFHIGDSLLFLYPPSEDSVVQVSEGAFNACVVGDPILKMKDGNSVFNLSSPGIFYFTSGVAGRCEKRQKLRIAVPGANGAFSPPSPGASGPVAAAYPLRFGPNAPDGSAVSARLPPSIGGGIAVAVAVAVAVAFVGCLF